MSNVAAFVIGAGLGVVTVLCLASVVFCSRAITGHRWLAMAHRLARLRAGAANY